MSTAVAHGLAVLLVDDSALIRKRVRRLLEENPRVRTLYEAGNGTDAWTLFKLIRPDVVVLDLRLPDFNGVELLQKMKQARPSCMVIVMSSLHGVELKEECFRLGASVVLHKASEFEKLFEILAGSAPAPASEPARPPVAAS